MQPLSALSLILMGGLLVIAPLIHHAYCAELIAQTIAKISEQDDAKVSLRLPDLHIAYYVASITIGAAMAAAGAMIASRRTAKAGD